MRSPGRRCTVVAEGVIEERQLLKSLRWYDEFVIALANPGFLLGSPGFSVGDSAAAARRRSE
jgi:hypothetical protein